MLRFTKKEISVLLFLLTTYLMGSGVRIWQRFFRPLPVLVNEKNVITHVSPDTGQISVEMKKLDVNTATRKQLEGVPGIGPVLSQRICIFRDTYGKFKKIEDLCQVKGIGQKKLKKISEYVIIQ